MPLVSTSNNDTTFLYKLNIHKKKTINKLINTNFGTEYKQKLRIKSSFQAVSNLNFSITTKRQQPLLKTIVQQLNTHILDLYLNLHRYLISCWKLIKVTKPSIHNFFDCCINFILKFYMVVKIFKIKADFIWAAVLILRPWRFIINFGRLLNLVWKF